MPKIRSSKRGGKPPEGYDKVEPTINRLLDKLKQVQHETSTNKSNKNATVFKMHQLNHQISRYVYVMHYERHMIDKPLYEWLLKQKYVNKDLIAKWKKQGYEKLCCLNCIMKPQTNFNTTCICRVPKLTLQESNQDKEVECVTCGCRGCSSTD